MSLCKNLGTKMYNLIDLHCLDFLDEKANVER